MIRGLAVALALCGTGCGRLPTPAQSDVSFAEVDSLQEFDGLYEVSGSGDAVDSGVDSTWVPVCGSTASDCADVCAKYGACHCVDGRCVALSDADCQGTSSCKWGGFCHVVHDSCRPTSQEDCDNSFPCYKGPGWQSDNCHYCQFNCCTVSYFGGSTLQIAGCMEWTPSNDPLNKKIGDPCTD